VIDRIVTPELFNGRLVVIKAWDTAPLSVNGVRRGGVEWFVRY